MLNYKLSDSAKRNAIWSLLNVNYTEENNWLIEFDVCEVYDDYAVVRNYAEGCWERVYYTKNDETDSLEINNRERCYIMDVSEAEKSALDALHGMNGNTYEKVDENYSEKVGELETANAQIETLNGKINSLNGQIENLNGEMENKNSEFCIKIEELNEIISTLSTERDDNASKLSEAEGTITSLTDEVATLNSFKAGVEKKEKEAVISKYAELLENDVLDQYSAKLGEYTAKDLDKELAYELVSNKAAVFSREPQLAYVPKDDANAGGLEEILNKWMK